MFITFSSYYVHTLIEIQIFFSTNFTAVLSQTSSQSQRPALSSEDLQRTEIVRIAFEKHIELG